MNGNIEIGFGSLILRHMGPVSVSGTHNTLSKPAEIHSLFRNPQQ